VINITTGGSPFMTVEERVLPAATHKPELASLNMGSMNFGLYPMQRRFPKLTHQWERDHLENSRDLVFRNTFKDIEYVLSTLSANGTRFEFECYDIGHLYNLAHMLDRGLVKPPLFVQSVLGLLGGIGSHPDDILMMRRTADRLLGADYEWSVLGAGAAQMRTGAMALAMGGHMRVGLEDSLWAGPGVLATSSAEQVKLARDLFDGLNLAVATPDDARQILGLKGAAAVAF
ncbi:MAG: 3-keto-5-aminohexanoate cleavage protein, partial [Pseudomonadota bacterium]